MGFRIIVRGVLPVGVCFALVSRSGQTPVPPASPVLPVSAADAPACFVWWNSRSPNRATATTQDGRAPVCSVNPRGRAWFGKHHAMVVDGGRFEADSRSAASVVGACRRTGAVTVEAVITPARSASAQPAWILHDGTDGAVPNFGLWVQDGRLHACVATTDAGPGGLQVQVGAPEIERAEHVVLAYDGRQGGAGLSCWLNGQPVAGERRWAGGLTNWAAGALTFGGSPRGDPWFGRIEGVRVEPAAADEAGVLRRYRAVAPALACRRPSPRIVVQGRLRSVSDPPDRQIYARALVLNTYDVLKTLQGPYPHRSIQVYHWAILDRQYQTDITSRRPGAEYVLVLEPFEEHEALEAEDRTETKMDFQLPLFLDVGGIASGNGDPSPRQ